MKVTAIETTKDGLVLMLDGIAVPLDEVVSVRRPATGAAPQA